MVLISAASSVKRRATKRTDERHSLASREQLQVQDDSRVDD